MSSDFGNNIVSITGDDGKVIELEVLIDMIEYKDGFYGAYLPADADPADPDYGMIILRSTEDESGEMYLEDVDNEEDLDALYDIIIDILYPEE